MQAILTVFVTIRTSSERLTISSVKNPIPFTFRILFHIEIRSHNFFQNLLLAEYRQHQNTKMALRDRLSAFFAIQL